MPYVDTPQRSTNFNRFKLYQALPAKLCLPFEVYTIKEKEDKILQLSATPHSFTTEKNFLLVETSESSRHFCFFLLFCASSPQRTLTFIEVIFCNYFQCFENRVFSNWA